jgi:hypothetical protein
MINKAALVGCRVGPWVPIHGLIEPELRASGEAGSIFNIEHVEGKSTSVGCGTHRLSSQLLQFIDAGLWNPLGLEAVRATKTWIDNLQEEDNKLKIERSSKR